LVDALAHVRREGARVPIDPSFNLKALVGETRMRRYYRYDGSLTTPPCYESVVWSVVQEPIKLSLQQLQAFKILHNEKNKLLENVYRTIQPLGSRKLFRSFVHQNQHDEPKRKAMVQINSGQNLVMKTNVFLMMIGLFIAAY
jgi:carbonic anhydrase